jgi:oligosaccharide repeat unit polymerase
MANMQSARFVKTNLPSFVSLRIVLLVSAFRAILDLGYLKFVYPVFGYDGFDLDFDEFRFIISWLTSLAILLVLERRRNSSLIYIFFLVYVVVLLPSASYYALGAGHSGAFWANLATFVLLLIFLPRYKQQSKIMQETNHSELVVLFSVLFTVACLIYLVTFTGGRFVIAFQDVYDFREDNIRAYEGVFGYFISWAMKVFAPFLLSVALIRKKTFEVIFAGLLVVLFFMFTGHKSALLPIVLCAVSYVFIREDAGAKAIGFSVGILIGAIALSVLGLLLYFAYDEVMFSSVLFRRAFFTPIFLNAAYFDMFEQFDFVYWSNSVLSPFSTYQFDDTVSHEVGAHVGRPGMGANTGFVASGFMQAGYFGVAIYVLIIIVFNRQLIRISSRINPVVFNGVLFMPFLTLFSSSDLPTTIFTHGLGVSLVLLGLYGRLVRIQ